MDDENPSVGRWGCRVVAQTSKHILVFAFDPLSLNSLLYLTLLYIVHITYMLGIDCVPILVC